MTSQVEELAKLLKQADENSVLKGITDYEDALLDNAEYLIANGVIVLDIKVLSPKNRPLITHFANMPLDEVMNLVEAKKRERVIVPSCKIGDTVYLPSITDCGTGTLEHYEIIEIGQDESGQFFRVNDEESNKIYVDEIGKTVFLTRNESENKSAQNSFLYNRFMKKE